VASDAQNPAQLPDFATSSLVNDNNRENSVMEPLALDSYGQFLAELKSRIRRRHDLIFKKGEAIGYVDRQKNIRRPRWAVSRRHLIGRVVFQGIELELRAALEPWHVLARRPDGTERCATSILPWKDCR
jgi:hypothetical protein